MKVKQEPPVNSHDRPPAPGTDRFLRAHGFAIHARPTDGAATWRDTRSAGARRVLTEAAAHALAEQRETEANLRDREAKGEGP